MKMIFHRKDFEEFKDYLTHHGIEHTGSSNPKIKLIVKLTGVEKKFEKQKMHILDEHKLDVPDRLQDIVYRFYSAKVRAIEETANNE